MCVVCPFIRAMIPFTLCTIKVHSEERNVYFMRQKIRYGVIFWLGSLLFWANMLPATPVTNQLLSITAPWHFTAANVDALPWVSPEFDDSAWSGPSNALFYIESAALPAKKSTPLPPRSGGGPLPCYFLRSTFTVTNLENIVFLRFDHLIDDGAVIYLNGVEVQRIRMDVGGVSYSTQANDSPGNGDATAYETFSLMGSALTNLVEGTNVLAVRVHQYGTTSSDVVFGAKVSLIYDPDPVVQLTRGPYLQVCTPTGIRIRWRTDLPEESWVRCGTTPESLSLTYGGGFETAEHEVAVTNLVADTRYYYSIGTTAHTLAGGDGTCSFRTHPLSGTPKPLRVWVTGDAGTASDHAREVRDVFETANAGHPVDAWLQLGDNAYDSGTDAQYQAGMFDMYPQRLRQTAVWTTIGNHETYSTDPNGLYPYLNIFSMPTEGEAGGLPSHTNLYYSFDIGMVHVVSLDLATSDRSSNGAMAVWLADDLAATTNRWLIVFCHHPPYTKGSHDSDGEIELIEMRENILPILEAGGADLVLSGHSHSYERSRLLNGHYGYSETLTDDMFLNSGKGQEGCVNGTYVKPVNAAGPPIANRGTVYVVAGSSGKISGGVLNHPVMIATTNEHGSVVLDIGPERLDASFLIDTGVTNDWFTIFKTNYPPIAGNRMHTVAADAPTNLALTAADVNRNLLSYRVTALPTNGLLTAFDSASGVFTYTPARGCTNGDSLLFTASDGQLISPPATVTFNVQPLPDADGNGLPDEWEKRHGINDPQADPDRDGATNLAEYYAGTDPNDRQSWLRITHDGRVAEGFKLTWASSGGTRYRILYSDGDVTGGFNGVFTPLLRPVSEEMDSRPTGTPGTLSFTDDLAVTGVPARGCRFFRISVVR